MGRGVAELERLVGDLIQFASGARGEMVLRPTMVPVADDAGVGGGGGRGEKARVHGACRLESAASAGPASA